MTAPAHVVGIRTGELLDAVILGARDPDSRREVARLLRATSPAVPFQLVAAGLRVDAGAVHRLLDGVSGLDLRWSAEASQFAENRRDAWRRHAACVPLVARIRDGGRKAADPFLAGVA